MSRLIQYIKDTRSELHHVSWPSRHQATLFTGIVIGVSLLTAGYLGLFDWIFTTLIERLII